MVGVTVLLLSVLSYRMSVAIKSIHIMKITTGT